ncbi:hypothetical protein M2347_003363 [Chryseobacterium sp. H1D6B]|uniref:T9SS type A sorting domain-containing protein n=1 Tax=Chryseobacterium sp. H1D6B TaxID=2940588 RepID=UPI0015C9038F|nr:T9SS type A sorting domain-containing protein [Chryseobacterium sp. H1D6B]MDH6253636.1 hypothetical protein [Chryseobacterium sp. H1D6B]
MKKTLFFSLFASLVSLNAYSQTETISFETSEGYTLGDVNGQKGWTYWGGLDANTGMVANTSATNGVNSMNFASFGYMEEAGAEKAVTGYNKTEYSFDYKIEAIGGSDYTMAVWDAAYAPVAVFSVGYQSGNLRIYDDAEAGVVSTTTNLTPGTWYNLKMIVDMTARTVEYFVNNTSLGVKTVSATATGFNIIDFYYDDFETGYTVDNIKIINAAQLATSEVSSKNTLTVSPNPTSDFINIKTQEKITSVELFDASGKLVLTTTTGTDKIKVSELEKGLYLVKINTAKGSTTKKMMKN